MLRRRFLSASALSLPFLAACATIPPGSGVTLSTVQSYVNDTTDALAAGAETLLAKGANAAVFSALTALQALRQNIDAATMPATTKGWVLESIEFMQALEPFVMPLLPPAAAVAIPLALSVLHAFVNDLAMPANASVTPPAALHAAAMRYRLRHHR